MTPITDIIKELKQRISDLEWDGKLEDADRLQWQLKHYQVLLASGQIYEPNF